MAAFSTLCAECNCTVPWGALWWRPDQLLHRQPSFPDQACLLQSVKQGVREGEAETGDGQSHGGARRSPWAGSKGPGEPPRPRGRNPPPSSPSADFLLKDAQAGSLCPSAFHVFPL